jgi:hypothetical protein
LLLLKLSMAGEDEETEDEDEEAEDEDEEAVHAPPRAVASANGCSPSTWCLMANSASGKCPS